MKDLLVQFYKADKAFPFSNRTALKLFISHLFERECIKLYELRYIFCSDEYLLDINRQFLNHDYYTDIISFDLSESARFVEGEIYISVDRVKENAKQARVSYQEEMLRVLFHGALHLCGYKDKKKSDIKLMRQKEEEYIRLYLKK